MTITDGVVTYNSLSNMTVNMSGVSELHITSATAPLAGCTINLDSVDSFLFLENVKPSTANSTYLSQIKFNGANAVLGTNVRVVEYAAGAVIIPQSSVFQPLQVFTEENFQGNSAYLNQYTAYNTSSLGTMASSISSFILKRGYTATFAQNENGTGYSKNYVAQDCDLEIGVLPGKLNDKINFVRVFPWRWVSKKGIAGNIGSNLNIKWWYNWNLDQNSTLDKEYVPIRQNRWWPGLNQNWQTRGASHLLGYNEPDNSSEANIAVSDAIWSWPDLLGTGLRVGSPAPTDGGRSSWLYPFIQHADAADLRVDFVAVHYYWCYNPSNASGAATQMYNFLKEVHDNTGRPIWVTEWNNGANWTGCGDPTYAQQAAAIGAMIDMLDSTPWVERYAIYNWVEDVRRVEWDDGWPTDAGAIYRDQVSPIGYLQEVPGSGRSTNAIYCFDENFRDSSGNGNNLLRYGAPKLTAGRDGNVLVLDGADDYLVLPTHIGECADFTFAAWVYWNGGNPWQRIFDFGNNTTQYMFLTPSSGGNTLRFGITTSGNSSGEQQINTSGLTVGQWTHVAVTLNSNVGTIYVNGTPRATNASMTINPSDFQPSKNYLGKSQWPDPLFNGMMDDVMIADYALTADQIAELMTTTQPAQFITAPLNIISVAAGSEESGNPAVNSYDRNRGTRWANDGTVANAWIKYDLGAVSEIDRVKVKLNSGNSRTYPVRIEVDGVQVFSGNTNMTSGYWQTSFTPTRGRYVTITMTGNNSAGSGWFSILESQIWSPLNKPPFFNTNAFNEVDATEGAVYSSTLADNASDLENGLLIFSKDAGSDWLIVSPDGTLSGIPQDSNVGANAFTVRVTDPKGFYDTATMTIQAANVYSGVRGLEDLYGLAARWLMQNCVDTPACNGADLNADSSVDMSDVSVLASHWLSDENLQLHFKFDEMSGDAAMDDSIYKRYGLLVNGPIWSPGVSGGALSFDGVDDYVVVSDYQGIAGSASRTCTAWIKTTPANIDQNILSWGTAATGQKWMFRTQAGGGEPAIAVWGGYCKGNTSVCDNQWHHVAAVLVDDGSATVNEVLLYVDGQLQAPSFVNTQAVNTLRNDSLYIGAFENNGLLQNFFCGLIDDVRIYHRALDAEEIAEITK
ncbi:MAG: LamG-like jellyroll fold domain-containing protein [Anaerohalosphaeraceae bacterium]